MGIIPQIKGTKMADIRTKIDGEIQRTEPPTMRESTKKFMEYIRVAAEDLKPQTPLRVLHIGAGVNKILTDFRNGNPDENIVGFPDAKFVGIELSPETFAETHEKSDFPTVLMDNYITVTMQELRRTGGFDIITVDSLLSYERHSLLNTLDALVAATKDNADIIIKGMFNTDPVTVHTQFQRDDVEKPEWEGDWVMHSICAIKKQIHAFNKDLGITATLCGKESAVITMAASEPFVMPFPRPMADRAGTTRSYSMGTERHPHDEVVANALLTNQHILHLRVRSK